MVYILRRELKFLKTTKYVSQKMVVQFYPNKLSITHPRCLKSALDNLNEQYLKSVKLRLNDSYIENFKAVKNPFILSKASKRKLFDSINAMFFFSKEKSVVTKTGKTIYNFKASFITLTLPSRQKHSDKEIKKDCLNQLLVELRKHYGVKNYVWKAELQKNENIHFHIILDKYVDFQALRRRWNRILEKKNYITAYSEKFQKINLSQYHAMRNQNASCSFEKSKAAFAVGKKCNWRNPNSVDIRSILNKKNLATYLGKYISKQVSKETISDELTARQTNFGRSWSRSESLSRLKFNLKIDLSLVSNIVNSIISDVKGSKFFQGDFFKVVYFNSENLYAKLKKWHFNMIYGCGVNWNYPFNFIMV